jgi:hypothetical protein
MLPWRDREGGITNDQIHLYVRGEAVKGGRLSNLIGSMVEALPKPKQRVPVLTRRIHERTAHF